MERNGLFLFVQGVRRQVDSRSGLDHSAFLCLCVEGGDEQRHTSSKKFIQAQPGKKVPEAVSNAQGL